MKWCFLVAVIGLLTTSLAAQDEQAEQPARTAASVYNDALEKMKAKDYEAALPLVEEAIELVDTASETDQKVLDLSKTNGAIATYYVGNGLRKAGEYEDALARFEQGIEYNPDFYGNFMGRAQSLEKLERETDAAAAYILAAEKAKAADKNNLASKFVKKVENMAIIAVNEKRWSDAQSIASSVLEAEETENSHYLLGRALLEQDKYSDATAHLEKAIEMGDGKEDSKYSYLLGTAYEGQGQKAKAIEAYGKVTDAPYKQNAEYKLNQLKG